MPSPPAASVNARLLLLLLDKLIDQDVSVCSSLLPWAQGDAAAVVSAGQALVWAPASLLAPAGPSSLSLWLLPSLLPPLQPARTLCGSAHCITVQPEWSQAFLGPTERWDTALSPSLLSDD